MHHGSLAMPDSAAMGFYSSKMHFLTMLPLACIVAVIMYKSPAPLDIQNAYETQADCSRAFVQNTTVNRCYLPASASIPRQFSLQVQMCKRALASAESKLVGLIHDTA